MRFLQFLSYVVGGSFLSLSTFSVTASLPGGILGVDRLQAEYEDREETLHETTLENVKKIVKLHHDTKNREITTVNDWRKVIAAYCELRSSFLSTGRPVDLIESSYTINHNMAAVYEEVLILEPTNSIAAEELAAHRNWAAELERRAADKARHS